MEPNEGKVGVAGEESIPQGLMAQEWLKTVDTFWDTEAASICIHCL